MNFISVGLYKPYRNHINNSSTSPINKNKVTFTSNTKNLNKDVFVQRNIINSQQDLGDFVETVLDKIYESDPSPYEIPEYLKDNFYFNYYNDIVASAKVLFKDNINTLEHVNKNSFEYVQNLINNGIEYEKQVTEYLNTVYTNTRNILIQYGIDPKELTEGKISIKSSAFKKVNELLQNPAIEKETETILNDYRKFNQKWDPDPYDSIWWDSDLSIMEPQKNIKHVLILPDKNNTGTVVKFKIDNDTHNNTRDVEISIKDKKNEFDLFIDNNCITAKNGAKLNIKYGTNQFIKYNIKDNTNNILYTYKNNNGNNELVSVFDSDKDLMLILAPENSKNRALKLAENKDIALGTSLYTNLLQPKKPMGACVVLPYGIRKDQKAIIKELEPHVLNGVGTGFDLSNTEEPAKVLKSLNEILKDYDNKTQRPPAGIAILDVTHKDIFNFINAKRNANFNDWRFNISVSVSNDFMQKVANNKNVKLTDGKVVPARSIYNAIINSMHYCGEPGIIFKDNVEAANPVPSHEYKGMASCAEIGLEEGEMCLFSHINLGEYINDKGGLDFRKLRIAAESLTRLLDNVIDINIKEKVGEDNIASQKRRFGIGVCGFADLLAKLGIPYDDWLAQRVLRNCLEVINYASKKESMKLAMTKGAFPLFDESRYKDPEFLRRYYGKCNDIYPEYMWDRLNNNIQKFGIRNATTTSLPPTGSSSRIVGASYSIEPYFDLRNNKIFQKKLEELNLTEEQKKQVIDTVNKTGSCQNIEFLPKKFRDVFKIGREINYKDHIRIVGEAQRLIDDGISKTVNLENSATTDDIDAAVRMAYDLDLKGIAVFRDGC